MLPRLLFPKRCTRFHGNKVFLSLIVLGMIRKQTRVLRYRKKCDISFLNLSIIYARILAHARFIKLIVMCSVNRFKLRSKASINTRFMVILFNKYPNLKYSLEKTGTTCQSVIQNIQQLVSHIPNAFIFEKKIH